MALAALSLAGCKPAGSIAADKCYPKDVLRWMAHSGPAEPRKDGAGVGQSVVYIDRSGSMVGYLDGGTNAEKPFQDLVATLPSVLRLQGSATRFMAFGTRIDPVTPANGDDVDLRGLLSCRNGSGCDNLESHLDNVFGRVRDDGANLSIIVSDLWFENSEVSSTGIAALQPALVDLLLAGKVIAVYGINAPFSGKIYDLPDQANGSFSIPYSGRHPLYMVVVGNKQAVVKFDESLAASGSRFIADGQRAGMIRRTLFALDPGPERYPDAKPLVLGTSPAVKPDYMPLQPGVQAQSFVIAPATGAAMAAGPGLAGAATYPRWTGPRDDFFLKDAVWKGETAGRTRIWANAGGQCQWIDRGTIDLGWQAPQADGKIAFVLDPERFRAALVNEGTYLVVGEAQRTHLLQPNPATDWMRGEWNLDPVAAPAIAARSPTVFPTLNLSEFGRIMEGALEIAASRRKQAVVGFAVMVKLQNR